MLAFPLCLLISYLTLELYENLWKQLHQNFIANYCIHIPLGTRQGPAEKGSRRDGRCNEIHGELKDFKSKIDKLSAEVYEGIPRISKLFNAFH